MLASTIYKRILKPIFFLFDPELVHNFVTTNGELFGNLPIKHLIYLSYGRKHKMLKQRYFGLTFESPMGLAAGFDYEAKVTQILPHIGFGFNTVGTITNLPYKGNPKPMLGRLPKSKSLMVNKGFKNKGAEIISDKLLQMKFQIPLGISIGRSNTNDMLTQKESIKDILKAFRTFEGKRVKNSYYEINISCPNLFGDITFYPPKNLNDLLLAVDSLKLKKPLFIKMPIEKSDKEVISMLDVIIKHNVQGVIFGNLQKNRKDKALIPEEVKKFSVGNFSGKPTEKRSNELITLSYKKYGQKLLIIGCGGVFNAEDAYRKIKLGASLVQLITGLIYEGPLLVAQINKNLPTLLKNDGYKNISEAIGKEN